MAVAHSEALHTLLEEPESYSDATFLDHLQLNYAVSGGGRLLSRRGRALGEYDVCGALDIEMVAPRGEGSDFPPHPSIDLNHQEDGPGRLLLSQRHRVERRHRHRRPVDEWRPHVHLFVPLISLHPKLD